MSINNVQRDGFWLDPNQDRGTVSSNYPESQSNVIFNNPGLVFTDFGTNVLDHTVSQTITTAVAFGIIMAPPYGDNWPFRIKAGVNVQGVDSSQLSANLCVGYVTTAPTGSDDTMVKTRKIPFPGVGETMMMVTPQLQGDTYYGDPIAFAIEVQSTATISNASVMGAISVQNMGIKPPTMQNAVP